VTDPVKAIARRISRRCGSLATLELRDQRSAPWRSLLFNGAHHRIGLTLFGDHVKKAVDALEAEISDADFAISGHIVAELKIVEVDYIDTAALVIIDALTIEEGC
jgi:hypothetical protein